MKKFLKFALKKIIPLTIRNFLYDIRNPRFEYKSFGNENPDKKFLVIGEKLDKSQGLFSILSAVLMHIRYCVEHNIIPVVDMKNFDNQYLYGLGTGKENSWEYFFEQPFVYGLEQIKNSKNIIFTKRVINPHSCISKYRYFRLDSFDRNFALFQDFKNDFKQYIKFKETAKNYIYKEYERIFNGKKRVLGVLARGTDYLLRKPKDHRIQPEPNLILEKSRQIMQDYKCNYIYLATEDELIYKLFLESFGDKLVVNKQKRIDLKENEWLFNINFGRERDKYNLGLEYLSSIYNLSKCECFVGGVTNGTMGVFLMTEGFEYKYIYDLGNYK
jgi:hypothetical protein